MANYEKDLITVMAGRSPQVIKYVECSCTCSEHTMRFMWFDEPEDEEIYVHIFLTEYGFWKRLWHGIKYILGIKSKYGHFDEFLLAHSQVEELNKLCNKWLQCHIRPPSTPEEKLKVASLMVAFREKSLEKAKIQYAEAYSNAHKEEIDGEKQSEG